MVGLNIFEPKYYCMMVTTREVWDNTKYKDAVDMQCDRCGKLYNISKYQFCSNTRRNGVIDFEATTYCSKECRVSRQQKHTYSCPVCMKTFEDRGNIKRKFCSHACSAKHNNKTRQTIRTRTVACSVCNDVYTVAKHVVRKQYRCNTCKPLKVAKPKVVVTRQRLRQCRQCKVTLSDGIPAGYCSDACRKQSRRRFAQTCCHCEKSYFAENRTSKFCSHACRSIKLQLHKYAHVRSGLSRSKIEHYVENRLNEDFPSIEFSYNDKNVLGLELDIYSPSLNLAFELNGVFHYLPIHGEDVLRKIQTRDALRVEKCAAMNIELHSIDLGNEGFTKQHAVRIYQLVHDIIQSKLEKWAVQESNLALREQFGLQPNPRP